MSAGIGALSAFAVGTESPSTPLTPAADSVYYPILSESIRADRNAVPSASIIGDSMTSAVASGSSQVEGGFQMELEGGVSGHAIWLWNGNDGYTHSTFTPGTEYANTAPTPGSPSAGGSLADGAYKWGYATVLNRTTDNRKIIMPGTAASTAATTTTGNNTVQITMSNPSAVPEGHTHVGNVIYRTLIGGNTLYFLKYQSGTSTTFTDDGSLTVNQAITPYSATINVHEMIGSPPVQDDRLTPFTVYCNHNNGRCQRAITARMDQMKLGVNGLDDKIMLDFTLKAAAADDDVEFTPSYTAIEPFVGWHCVVKMNGVKDSTIESFEINCANNVQFVPGMRGEPYNRDTISGARQVQGQLSRQFEDIEIWKQMLEGRDFSLEFTSYGQCVANPVAHGIRVSTTNGGIDAVPWQNYIKIDLFRCKLNRAGGNTSGPDRIIEQIGFMAFKEPTEGTEMKITLWNNVGEYV